MRRRSLFATCMNHPGRIVEIEGRLIIKQRHMCFPIRLNGTHVLPISSKRISIHTPPLCQHRRNNIVAGVMLCRVVSSLSSSCIINQDLNECIAIEDIDTHRTESATWLVRFLFKRNDLTIGARFQYAKAVPFFERHNHCAKSDASVVLLVEGDHWPIVHAIDMVACKDKHIVAASLHDE